MAYKCIKAEHPGVEGKRQKEKIYITQSAEALKLIKFFWMELGNTAKLTSERALCSPSPQHPKKAFWAHWVSLNTYEYSLR